MRDYRKQRLLFFVAQDISDELKSSVRTLVEQLAIKRSWVIAPPSFVDALDDAGSREEDFPDATVGGSLLIFSALDSGLPRDIDIKNLQDVEEVVAEVQALSESEKISFEFELDGKFVGAIDDGRLDKSLSEGLIGEWRRHLGV